MKRTVKIVSLALVLVVALIATMVGVTATTTTTAVVYGDMVNLSENNGSTFDVGFHFKNNDVDVEAGKINLSWDANKVSAENIVATGVLAADGVDFTTSIDNEAGSATVAWAGSTVKSNTAAGDLFKVTFDKTKLGETDTVTVGVDVEAFGYTALFIPYNLAESVTANAALASSGDVNVYTGTTQEEAIAWLESVVSAAKFGNVDAKIGSDLKFTSSKDNTVIDFGTAGDVSEYTISFSSVDVAEGSNPYGFDLDGKTILNFYANVSFNNIKLDGANAWSSGGCIQVTEGSAVFGVNDAEQDYGNIYVPSDSHRINIAGGDLEVYTGNYRAICANYYKTYKTVDTPSITVAGNTTGQYVMGGSHNGHNTVTGKSAVVVGGSIDFENVIGGSWCSGGVGANGGTLTVDGTPTIKYLVASCVGDVPTVNPEQYVMTVKGGSFSYVANHMFTTIGEATINAKTIFNGGSVSSYIMGGSISNWTSYSNAYQKNKTTNKFYGSVELEVNATPGCPIIGGSYMLVPDAVHGADSVVTLNGLQLGDVFYGGSYISRLSTEENESGVPKYLKRFGPKGAYTYHNCENAVHSGDTVLNIKNGTTLKHPDYVEGDETYGKKGIAAYGGSYISADDSSHTGNTEINMFVDEGNEATHSFYTYDTFYCGSSVRASGTYHTGRIKSTVDKAVINVVSSSWGGLMVGPIATDGGYVSIESTETEKGIELTVTNTTANKRVAAGYISSSNKTFAADTLITVGAGNDFDNVFGGICVAGGTAKFEGDTKVVLNTGSTSYMARTWGGSYSNSSGAKMIGDSSVEIQGGTIAQLTNTSSEIYGVFGGGYLANSNVTFEGDSTVTFKAGTVSRALFAGSYIDADGKTGIKHQGNSTLNLEGGEITSGTIVGGSLFYKGSGSHSGNSEINLKGTTMTPSLYAGSKLNVAKSYHIGNSTLNVTSGSTTGTVYGGSYIANGTAQHQGDSHINISGGSTGTMYGGSFLISVGASHKGNSYIDISNITLSWAAYAGSRIYQEETNHFGDSLLTIHSGTVTASVYGGSYFPASREDASYTKTNYYGHIGGSGVIVKSGTIKASYIWGGSYLNNSGASIAKGYAVHGVKYQAANGDTPEVKASKTFVTFEGGTFTGTAVYGGAYCGKSNTKMYGDIEVNIGGNAIVYVSERVAGLYTAGGGNEFHGNSKITISGTAVIAKNGTVASSGGVVGGLYGTGTMVGNSAIEIKSTRGINSLGGIGVTAGCHGTNDISTEAGSSTKAYGGIRQTGDVSFIISSGYCNDYTSVCGYRSNIDGDVIFDVSGNATFGSIVYVLARSASDTAYASCTGDIKAYLSGTPTFKYALHLASSQASSPKAPANGYNVCMGDVFLENSGKVTFNGTTNAHCLFGGAFGTKNDTVFKLIGDAEFKFTNLASGVQAYFYRYSSSFTSVASARRILDLTQYTGGKTVEELHVGACLGGGTYDITVWEPLKDKVVDLGTTTIAAGTEMKSLVNGKNVKIGNTTVSYADLTKFDDLSKSPNAFKFYSAEQNKEITKAGVATKNIYVMSGAVKSATMNFDNTSIAGTIASVNGGFGLVGNSIRTYGDLALRCRAYVEQAFLADHLDYAKGFKIQEIGILVAALDDYARNEMVVGGDRIVTAKAWENGELNSSALSNENWMTDETKYPGWNLFAAAVHNYTETRYARDVYFRPYMICEDENGDTLIVYCDLSECVDEENKASEVTVEGVKTTTTKSGSALISGEGFTQYTASLYKRAKYEADNNTEFYTANKATIDAIVAYVDENN